MSVTNPEYNLTMDDIDRPDWNSLEENYKVHDIGEKFLKNMADDIGATIIPLGKDNRHADSAEYGYFPDFLIVPADSENMLAIDVKTKRNKNFYPEFNKRHHDKYVDFSNNCGKRLKNKIGWDIDEELEINVFVVFMEVTQDSERIDDVDVFHVQSNDDGYVNSEPFPDGNTRYTYPLDASLGGVDALQDLLRGD